MSAGAAATFMIISSVTEIAAPPIKVWRVLSDFAAYPRWNPYRQVSGEAALGAKVTLLIGPKPERRRRIPATIKIYEPGHRLAFQTGRPLLGRAMESFVVEPGRRGTRLVHTAEMKGLGSVIFGSRVFEARLLGVYKTVDDALAKYVETDSGGQRSIKGRRRRPS